MITRQNLYLFDCKELHFYEPAFLTNEMIQYGYAAERTGSNLNLRILINYFVQDAVTEEPEKLVCSADSLYTLETDGSITVEELYGIVTRSTNLVRNYINQIAKTKDKPLAHFITQPIGELQEGLQEIADLLLAAGN